MLASSVIFVIFKLYEKYGVNTLQAIIFNYFIACTVGFLIGDRTFDVTEIHLRPWFFGTLLLGLLFISVFYLAALTTQRSGLSVVSVASKMSVAIPICFGIIWYQESTGWVKIVGIVLALLAVYLTSRKDNKGPALEKRNLLLPLFVFLGSGTIDTSIKFLEAEFVPEAEVASFSSTIFAVAGAIGSYILLFQYFRGTLKFRYRNLLGGLALGVPNFFSIYFLVLALRTEGFESSVIFPLNHVSIVMVSTLSGILLFREKLRPNNWLGITLAVLSILMIANA